MDATQIIIYNNIAWYSVKLLQFEIYPASIFEGVRSKRAFKLESGTNKFFTPLACEIFLKQF